MEKENNNSAKRLYELNYLVPLRESEKIIAVARKITDFIKKEKGELIEAEKRGDAGSPGDKSRVWVERKRLAYPIKNDKSGYYLNSWLKIEPRSLVELRRFLKLEKEILRYEILAEENISNPTPTQDSVKLDEIESLAAQQEKRPFGQVIRTPRPVEKPRYQEKLSETRQKAPALEIVKEEKPAKVKKELLEPEVKDELTVEIAKIAEAKPKVKKKKILKPVSPVLPNETQSGEAGEQAQSDVVQDDKEEKKGLKKPKKISLEDLDKRLDDILNEEIL